MMNLIFENVLNIITKPAALPFQRTLLSASNITHSTQTTKHFGMLQHVKCAIYQLHLVNNYKIRTKQIYWLYYHSQKLYLAIQLLIITPVHQARRPYYHHISLYSMYYTWRVNTKVVHRPPCLHERRDTSTKCSKYSTRNLRRQSSIY